LSEATATTASGTGLKRTLTLWDLVFYGIVIIQPTAPMGLFGIVSEQARGHVVTTILIGMFAMLLTALSYGRMARVYPSAGSAFTYVGQELHPLLGYATGWSMVMDYVLNPLICTIICASLAQNLPFLPPTPHWPWVIFFALLFTGLNLRGVEASARTNQIIGIGLTAVVALFLVAALRYLLGVHLDAADLTRPFYDPQTFRLPLVLTGTSIACLTYIGFDGISTLSEEVENPRRNVLLATVYTCLAVGILAALQVYAAQLVWGDWTHFPDVNTAFVHIAGKAGGATVFLILNTALLVANIGSGTGAQLGAARLLYGMGRSDALPRSFFGAVEAKRRIPRNNVLLIGVIALAGGLSMSLALGSGRAFDLGAEMLNFGAFIAFMGVNLAAFVHYFVREGKRTPDYLVLPLLGVAICGYLWWNLNWPAKLLGGGWLLAGMVYGGVRTRGFRRELINFEAPPE
jgi:amino acid transporter